MWNNAEHSCVSYAEVPHRKRRSSAAERAVVERRLFVITRVPDVGLVPLRI